MSEPVAWVIVWKIGSVDHIQWPACATKEEAQSDISMYGEGDRKDMRVIPLYAASPTYAMGVADAARVGRDLYKGDGSRLNSYDEGWNDALDAAEQAIRALSAPPSVTLDWVRKVADGVSSEGAAVLATLAALGISVEAK